MDTQTLLALLTFGVAASFTPGPNNLMLMTSGVNFGVTRTLPHLTGVVIGFAVMVLILGLGLAGLFTAWPASMTVLKVVSVAYTVWLAWKIARARPPGARDGTSRPLRFIQAAAFQWVNPKAWTLVLTAITLYAADEKLASILSLAAVLSLLTLASAVSWMLMGQWMGHWLASPTRLTVFNYGMATALLASLALAM